MDFVEILKTWGDSIIALVVGYIVGKPKMKSEIETTNVDNAGKIMDKWESYTDRLEKMIEQLKQSVSDLNDALVTANKERLACTDALDKLQKDYNGLLELVEVLELEIKRLKGE